jgi:leader peptidase (prepilin peptidase) / N-methyltransferase
MLEHVPPCFVLLAGMCIGSFLNVCIYRLPAGQSIVFPGSRCLHCGTAIRFYDNIPLASFVWLRGRCRHCRTAIPWRYPLVELLSGVLALTVFIKFGFSPLAGIYYVFISLLVLVTFIDIDQRIIPDTITLPGIPLFFAVSFAVPTTSVVNSLVGIVVGGGGLLLVAWAYRLIARKEGMGGGDIKLLAMIGALVGWQGVLFTVFVGSAIGSLTGLAIMLKTRGGMKLAVPFGPFLSLGTVVYIFWGPRIIRWYFSGM